MSVCSTCYDSGISLDYCNAGISFGYVTPETNYVVDIQHNATKKIQTFPVESDGDGIITLPDVKVDPLQGYTITLRDCATFTICEQEYTCITFSVVNSTADPSDHGVIDLLECAPC
jgi:hypothetical protein